MLKFMATPDTNPFKPLLEAASRHFQDLAGQRCTKLPCGLRGVLVAAPEPTQRTPQSNVVWLEDITHGVGCEYSAECPLAQNPMEVTIAFTGALQRAIQETGLLAILDAPDTPGMPGDN